MGLSPSGMGFPSIASAVVVAAVVAVVVATLLTGAARAADEVAIVPQQPWSGVFGGEDVTLNYTIQTPPDFRGRLGWSLSVEGRTLSRGEIALGGEAGRPSRAAVRLSVPEVKPGAVIRARLSLQVYDARRGGKLAGEDRTLWIFPRDPFALQSEWLSALKITLWDPQGDTQKVLQRAKVPFRQIHNVAALQQMTEGLLVVGQGISLEEHRSLPEILVRLAAGGVPVLWLAPSAGKLPMPGTETSQAGLPVPKRVVLRRQDAITALDKRLDAAGWPPDGRIVAGTVSITADRSRVMGQIGEEENGWSWVEVHYPGERATLLICGFSIVDGWDAGPTPRYLFAEILEYIAPPAGAAKQ